MHLVRIGRRGLWEMCRRKEADNHGQDRKQTFRVHPQRGPGQRVYSVQSRRPVGQRAGLWGHHQEHHRPGAARPGGRGAGPRHHPGIRAGHRHLLRRLCGPVRQPHRGRGLHPERQDIPAGGQQRPQPPARLLCPQELFGQGVWGHFAAGGGQPRRRGRLPRQHEDRGALHPDPGQRFSDGLPRLVRRRHHRQT